MVLVVSIRIPGSTVGRNTPRSVVWRHKIWECNAAWLGLALAFAASYTTAKGLKLLYGKPRPDLLARCKPDVSNIAAYAVGGRGLELPGAPILVSLEICQNRSKSLTVTGFTSFPSDHSSCKCSLPVKMRQRTPIDISPVSFAGLTYLSLWLCSKFSIAFPYLAASRTNHRPHDEEQATAREDSAYHLPPSVREEGAAPPIYMLIIVAIPIAVACFISASRWFDNRHNGVDILSGSALGVFCAWFGFRLYNLPIQRGAGWSWGPRSRNHAFLKGVGFPSHVGNDNWASGVESGRVALD